MIDIVKTQNSIKSCLWQQLDDKHARCFVVRRLVQEAWVQPVHAHPTQRLSANQALSSMRSGLLKLTIFV